MRKDKLRTRKFIFLFGLILIFVLILMTKTLESRERIQYKSGSPAGIVNISDVYVCYLPIAIDERERTVIYPFSFTNKSFMEIFCKEKLDSNCGGWFEIGKSCGMRNCTIMEHNGNLKDCFEEYINGFCEVRGC